jgi:hypothetical protein
MSLRSLLPDLLSTNAHFRDRDQSYLRIFLVPHCSSLVSGNCRSTPAVPNAHFLIIDTECPVDNLLYTEYLHLNLNFY